MSSKIKEDMNIVIVGHVDHGKSTIIGRLLYDTGALPIGKLEQIKTNCLKNSKPFEYAFLLDALKDEQEQGITIDSARCFFNSSHRKYMIIDAPGHKEFLKNMVTGASIAEAAILVIDANEGIKENSKRHCYMLSILGIRNVTVVINKMDLVDFKQSVFDNIVSEYTSFLNKIDVNPTGFIPVSGYYGDNVVKASENMLWYSGKTILEALDAYPKSKSLRDKPFRMYVQGIYKFTENGDQRIIIAGTIETGTITTDDEVTFLPSEKKSKVSTIEAFNEEEKQTVSAGIATGFTLDEQIYVRRGELATLSHEANCQVSNSIRAKIFWLGNNPLKKHKDYYLKIGTEKVKVRVAAIIKILDLSDLEIKNSDQIEKFDVAECILEGQKTFAFDLFEDNPQTSRFVIVDDYQISGGGIITQSLPIEYNQFKFDNHLHFHRGQATYLDRCDNMDQLGAVIWLTGLSASGKSTIAFELEKELIKRGKKPYVLDGDNIRLGLNSDLGFIEDERMENVRRICEVTRLLKDAGLITIVSLITPLNKMRRYIREKIGNDLFEVYVKSTIDTCISRDPKGLYKKAIDGQINNFTGISAPFEEPQNPDLILDTEKYDLADSVEMLIDSIKPIISI